MQKEKETNFRDKFRLLCSQENKEDIVWSLSDSSDYENVQTEKVHNKTNKHQNRKRKRKKKVPTNISNLDITVIDTKNDYKYKLDDEKSKLSDNNCDIKSPILKSQFEQKYCNVVLTSPILSSNFFNHQSKASNILKSPILVLKTASPTYSPKVRKKLFNDNRADKDLAIQRIHKSKTVADVNKIDVNKKYDSNIIRSHSMYTEHSENVLKGNNAVIEENNKSIVDQRSIDNDRELLVKKEKKILDISMDLPRPANLDLNLVKKVKSYFDGQFSSESASQHSISDTPTPKNSSKTSDDIDISNTITQINSKRNSAESIKEDVLENNNEKPKKFRYKKDGLAHRLNSLLKKYNANVSLWQHERFLAANSNFIIPKGEHLNFHVRNVQFKYGCYLLEARDVENCGFLIVINNEYVTDSNITKDIIFKLYEPYKIIGFDDHFKLIINVCKFDCISVC